MTQNAIVGDAAESDYRPAVPAKKKVTKKKVAAGARKAAAKKKPAAKKKGVRKARQVAAPKPMSAAAEALAERLAKAEASATTAKARVDELRTKVREARQRLKATGDKRAKRTIEGSAGRLEALNERVVKTAAAVTKARAELREQMREDAQIAARDAALAAAVEKFKVKWLKDYERRMRVRTRAARKQR